MNRRTTLTLTTLTAALCAGTLLTSGTASAASPTEKIELSARGAVGDVVETAVQPDDAVRTVATEGQEVTIPTRDGITLSGMVTRPAKGLGTGTDRAGKLPVVVMPGTFAGDAININLIAAKLAARGYVTVSYLERGFGDSGGEIDAGGPKDVADASDALTWALAHTEADPDRVGIASISYGAGFAPIAAAKDHRFGAVAMISGWGDMWESRYPNGTSAWASNLALQGLSLTSGRPSQGVEDFFANAVKNVYTPDMKELAAERSASTYLPQLARNPVPLYVSTSMNEMIWPADQTIDFFEKYPGRKHLDVLPGDHATTELGTPIGLPGITWNTAFDWLDTYVSGTGTRAQKLPAVRVAARKAGGSDYLKTKLGSEWPFEGYSSTAVRSTQRQYLKSSSSLFGLRSGTALAGAPGTAAKKLREGANLLLQNGIPMYQGGFEIITGNATTIPLKAVDQGVTGLWTGEPLARELKLRGATKVHLDLTPSAAKGSVFVYLLEQAKNGTTYVIGHKPYSWTGATPGKKLPVDVTVPYNAYDVPAGNRLIVGVSTGDVMYTDNNPAGSSLTVGPNSYVDLPVK